MLGWEFLVVPADVDESVQEPMRPDAMAEHLAVRKAKTVAASYPNDVVLAADTIVELQGKLFGKPDSIPEAKVMLSQLSGQVHRVYTGVCLVGPDNRIAVESDVTMISLTKISSEDLDWYVDRGTTLDKAGGYGIQDAGAVFVESIHGDFYNVMGLPLHLVFAMISNCFPELLDMLRRLDVSAR